MIPGEEVMKVMSGQGVADLKVRERRAVNRGTMCVEKNGVTGRPGLARATVEMPEWPEYVQQFVRYVLGQATSRDRNNVCARWGGRLRVRVVSRISRGGHIAKQNSRLEIIKRIDRRLPSIADDSALPSKFGHRG